MHRPIITLTTDFGLSDHFAGTMKGVILTICPEARIVDISNEVGAFGIAEGAFLHGKSYPPVGFSLFFSAHRKSQSSFPEAARMLFWQQERIALGRWTGTISREADLFGADDVLE